MPCAQHLMRCISGGTHPCLPCPTVPWDNCTEFFWIFLLSVVPSFWMHWLSLVSAPHPLLSSAFCPPCDPAHLLSVIVLLPTFLFSSHFEFPKALFVIFFIWYSIVCLFQEPSISENVQLFFFLQVFPIPCIFLLSCSFW